MAAFTDPCAIWPNGGSKLQTYLGTTIADVKTICLLESINKWSKRKPVRVAQDESLTDAQFKSAGGSAGTGYAYSVRVRYISTTSLANLHDWTFDYARPNDYYRLDDFYGYDKNATADVSGEFTTEAYRDMADNFHVLIDVDYQRTNTTGIPVKDLIKEELSMSGSTDATAFGYVYAFLLVGDYMCAMKNGLTNSVTPICNNGTWYTDFYGSLSALNAISQIPLGTSTPFSVALIRVMANDSIMRPWLDGAWRAIGGISGSQVTSVFAYPLPNAVGSYLNVKEIGRFAPNLTLQLPTQAYSTGFSVNYTFEETPVEDVIIDFNVTLKPDNITSVKSYTHEIDTGGYIPIAPSWSWTDFGLRTPPAVGTLYTLTVSATYYYASSALNVKTATKTGGLTVSASTGGLTPITD